MFDVDVYLSLTQIHEWFYENLGIHRFTLWAESGQIRKSSNGLYSLSDAIHLMRYNVLPYMTIWYNCLPSSIEQVGDSDEYQTSTSRVPDWLVHRYLHTSMSPQIAHILDVACNGIVSEIIVKDRSDLPECLDDKTLKMLSDARVVITTLNGDRVTFTRR